MNIKKIDFIFFYTNYIFHHNYVFRCYKFKNFLNILSWVYCVDEAENATFVSMDHFAVSIGPLTDSDATRRGPRQKFPRANPSFHSQHNVTCLRFHWFHFCLRFPCWRDGASSETRLYSAWRDLFAWFLSSIRWRFFVSINVCHTFLLNGKLACCISAFQFGMKDTLRGFDHRKVRRKGTSCCYRVSFTDIIFEGWWI